MEFRLEKWHRPLTGCGLFLLLAVLAGAWYADEAEKPPLVLQAEDKEKVVQEDSLVVRGLQEANEQKELRNPFSLLHETEQESEHMVSSVKTPREDGRVKPARQVVVSPAAGGDSSMPKGKEAAITLCGIVEGGGQRLALLKVGNNTVTVSLGEMVSAWQVTGIDAATVTVERSGQAMTLPLVMNGEARAK